MDWVIQFCQETSERGRLDGQLGAVSSPMTAFKRWMLTSTRVAPVGTNAFVLANACHCLGLPRDD